MAVVFDADTEWIETSPPQVSTDKNSGSRVRAGQLNLLQATAAVHVCKGFSSTAPIPMVEGKNTAHLMDIVDTMYSVWAADDGFLPYLSPSLWPRNTESGHGCPGAGGACSCSSGKTQAAISCIHAELLSSSSPARTILGVRTRAHPKLAACVQQRILFFSISLSPSNPWIL